MQVETKLAFTVPEFCSASGIGRSYLYELIKAGVIETRKAGSRTLIRKVDAEKWLDSLPKGETGRVAAQAGE